MHVSLLRFVYRCLSRIRRVLLPKRTDALDVRTLAREVLRGKQLVAVDVGAANGLLPHWLWLDGIAQIFQVEPRADACADLEAARKCSRHPEMYTVVQEGLSGEGGKRTLYVSNAPTGASLLRPAPESDPDCAPYVDPNYVYPFTELAIETKSLAAVMQERGESRIDMVKLDIQGAELEVLKGLGEGLRRDLLAVELEIGMHAFYPPEARFPAVEAFMNECGLELFDVRVARAHQQHQGRDDYYQREIFSVYENSPTVSARIWEFDALYFRKRSDVLRRGDPDLARRMMVAYITYNYFAEAHYLVQAGCDKGLFTIPEAESLQQAVVDLHAVRLRRPWLADTAFLRWVRTRLYPFVPRSAPRWCQYMYQGYPNG
jgi:FkbM family methyltransferase